MSTQFSIIDSHVHLDHIYLRHPEQIDWMQGRGYVPVSWSFASRAETVDDLKDYFKNQADIVKKLNKQGFKCFFLTGIHPRNITPDIRIGDAERLILPYLSDPLCLGIGEIGLETGSSAEQDIFLEQVNIGKDIISSGRRIGIHTPRNNKPDICRMMLSLLDGYTGIEEYTVIDHCSPETVSRVLDRGFYAGVTLSPGKTSLDGLGKIVLDNKAALNRIMCNTDSGNTFYEDLYLFHESPIFSFEIKKKMALTNAFLFFNLS